MDNKALLNLGDAVNVCMRFLHETSFFDDMSEEETEDYKEVVRSEMEQKCWIARQTNDAVNHLHDVMGDINPVEIATQIESDNLTNWCRIVQAEMRTTLTQLRLK